MPDSNSGRRWRLGLRIAKFVGFCAADLFIPDWITKPYSYLKKFHQTFLCTTLQDRLSLFAEAEEITDANRQEVIDLMVAELRETVPDDVPDAQLRDFCSKLLDSLRDANRAEKQGQNPNQKLQESLSRSFLANTPQKLEEPNLSNDQQQLGKLRVSAVLQGDPKPKTKFTFNPNDLPQLANYEFLQPIGEGGFARVYKALHKPTNEIRAIKIGAITEPDRFDRELKIVENLNDPHLLKYHEHGKFNTDKNYWIAMEYLGEQTLEDVMKLPDFRNQTENILLICEQMLKGLAALHHAGVIHRDIKPSNIMFDSQNRVKLIDFGLAKPLDNQSDMLSTKSIGKMVGTPFYMSPEQLRANKRLTPASDIYSFAIVATEMFTGKNPNAAETLADVILKACMQVPNLEGSNVPKELQGVLVECLQLEPERRPTMAVSLHEKWEKITTPMFKHIRFEKDRTSWLKIMETDSLSKYLQICDERQHTATPNDYNRYLDQEKIPAVNVSRLAEVLPMLQELYTSISVAQRSLVERKQRYALDMQNLSSSQMGERIQDIQNAEKAIHISKESFHKGVASILERETRSWQSHLVELKKAEDARQEAIRSAEMERKQKEKEESDRIQQKKQASKERSRKMVKIGSVGAGVLVGLMLVLFFVYRGWDVWVRDDSAKTLVGHANFVRSAAWSPDGELIVTGGTDNAAKIWSASTGKIIRNLHGHGSAVANVRWSPDGTQIFTGSNDGTAKIWDAKTGKLIHTLKGQSKWIFSVAWRPDGKQISTTSEDGTTIVWDAKSFDKILDLKGHTNWVKRVEWSLDGTQIATASEDKSIKIWDAKTGKTIRTLDGHSSGVTGLTWKSDGTQIATGSGDKTIIIWDVFSGAKIHTLVGHSDYVYDVAWSPKQQRIASVSEDQTIKIWDANTGKCVQTLKGHAKLVTSVAWSPDGTQIVTGSADDTAKIWNVK